MMFSCSSADSRGVANGIFSWGIYFGYGLAYIYGKYLTRWVPRPLMRSTTFTRQVPRQRGRAWVRMAGLLRGGRRTRHPHRPRHPPRDQVAERKYYMHQKKNILRKYLTGRHEAKASHRPIKQRPRRCPLNWQRLVTTFGHLTHIT